MPRVSKNREPANREYRRRRLSFLEKHPYCQVWLMETFVLSPEGIAQGLTLEMCEELIKQGMPPIQLPKFKGLSAYMTPRATEIHHSLKPKVKYLNDESTWFSVSHDMHVKIEENKSWARERGYLQNN